MKFLKHEIGSLAKPNWRVKAVAGRLLSSQDYEDALHWANQLSLSAEPLLDLLKIAQKSPLNAEQKQEIIRWSSKFAVRLLEKAGLDLVYDGEQFRTEMYEYPIRHIRGMELTGYVRSFEHKYYRKGACRSYPELTRPYHLKEFLEIIQWASKPVKIPITGAYTLVDWSYDEYFSREILPWDVQRQKEARRLFLTAMAREVIRPNLKALVEAGARWVQIDEPAVTTRPEEVPWFLEAFHQSTGGLNHHTRFTVHICFSDYRLLFPHIGQVENGGPYAYAIGFANYDSIEPGTKEAQRPGYTILKLFREHQVKARIGLGVIDIHTDFLEPAELVRDRILYAVSILGDPEKILVCTDCGLRTRTWEVAYEKLCRMVEGAFLAERLLN